MTVVNMQSRPNSFGLCYQCRDGEHRDCIGPPCDCECPPMGLQEAFERVMALQHTEQIAAAQFGDTATIASASDARVHSDSEVASFARNAAHNALNVQAINAIFDELRRLHRLINSPEVRDFTIAVVLEAAHQGERWGSEHDARKSDADWFWLIGYLAGKALHTPIAKDVTTDAGQLLEKKLHRIITIAAAAANWHAQTKERG